MDYSVVLWVVVVVTVVCTHNSIHYFSELLLQLTETMKSALADTQGSCHFSSQSVTTASGYEIHPCLHKLHDLNKCSFIVSLR